MKNMNNINKTKSVVTLNPIKLDVKLAFCVTTLGLDKVKELLSDIKLAHKAFSQAYQSFDKNLELYRDITIYFPQFKEIIKLIG